MDRIKFNKISYNIYYDELKMKSRNVKKVRFKNKNREST